MRRWLTLIPILLLALGGSVAVSWYLYDAETKQIEATFQRDINQRAYQLEKELVKLRATMRYWRKFYETSQATIEPEQFRNIAKDVLKSYPSLQIISWSPMVPKAHRAAFEKRFKRFDPQFSIFTMRPEREASATSEQQIRQLVEQIDPRQFFQPSGDQPLYFPIAVLEPQERVGFLIGLDVSSVNVMKVSAQVARTRDSGDIVALPALPSPFSSRHEPIMVALVPVYLGDANSVTVRRNALQGFIASIFSIEEMVRIASMADKPRDIGLQLIDMTGDEGMKVLYRYGEKIQRRMAYERPIMDVLGRRWTVVASPSDAYIAARRSLVPYLTLFGGALFIGLFLLYSNLAQRQTAVVQTQVDHRTRELRHANDELNSLNERLDQLSRIDSLTEVANRRQFNETLQREWKRACRENKPLAILLIDVDYFKRFNDQYGHLRGDECLQLVAKTLTTVFKRGGDLVSRYGGEEFAVVLPNAGAEAVRVAERCRSAVEELRIAHAQSDVADHVTVSIGISSVLPNSSMSPEHLLDCVDKGLYAAKEHGRNRVIYHTCHSRAVDMGSVGIARVPSTG